MDEITEVNGKRIIAVITEPELTLRDYFAAQALTGIATGLYDVKSIGKRCYEVADAMLAARSKK